MPSVKYRYGFNGYEKDIEVRKEYISFFGNSYNPLTGRRDNLDPFSFKQPQASPYSFALNNPIYFRDINGDSAWVSISVEQFTTGDGKQWTIVTHTVNVRMKILDLTGSLNSEILATQTKAELENAINNSGEKKDEIPAGNAVVIHRFVSGEISVQAVNSMEEVKASDHFSVVVDDALDSKNADGTTRASGGWGQLGLINYVENHNRTSGGFGCSGPKIDYTPTARSIVHEFGHNIGLPHEVTEKGNVVTSCENIMSYSPFKKTFDIVQLLKANFDGSNTANPNFEISTSETNNWFFHTSTNEEPYDLNVKVGEKIQKLYQPPKMYQIMVVYELGGVVMWCLLV